MRRLVEFKPHWIQPPHWSADFPFYVGLSFLCPHCPPDLPEHGEIRRRRLAVSFEPPIDLKNAHAIMVIAWQANPNAHRRVAGATFDDLTLEPSIGFDSIGHWHGRITNGSVAP